MAGTQNNSGQDGEIHVGTEEARQATRTGYMWRVLGLSLLFGSLVVLAAWLWVAGSRPHQPPGQGAQVRVVAAPRMGPPPAKASPDQVVRPSPQGQDSGTCSKPPNQSPR
jgi:hypothetical protein